MGRICNGSLLLIVMFAADAHAQVQIDASGDTLKGNVKRMTQYYISRNNGAVVGLTDTIKSVYTYDESRRIELVKYSRKHDQETTREEIFFDSKGNILERRSYTDLDSLYRRCTYKYNSTGKQIESHEINYPFHASYPFEVGEVSIEFNDSLGSDILYIYDSMGRLAEKTQILIWDSRKTTDNIAAYRYDAKGNKTEEYNLNLRACDQEQKYFLFYINGKGYSTKTVFKYDSLNRLAERTEYSEEKNPSALWREQHTGTFIGRRTVYNYSGQNEVANGNTVVSLYREADGSITKDTPMQFPNWDAKADETVEYDNHGNVIRKTRWNQLVFERTIEYY